MGSEEVTIDTNKISYSNSWPNRVWMNYNYNFKDLEELIKLNVKKDFPYIVSLWEYDENIFHKSLKTLESHGYKVLFEQIGMSLDIKDRTFIEDVKNRDFEITIIHKKEDILTWIQIASESFGYIIDESIIFKVFKDENISLLLGYKNGVAVATTLLYESDNIMGVHLVGVPSRYRKQGIAEYIMKQAILITKEKNIDTMTLQASSLGLGVYKKLGFQENFLLRNYQK